MANLIGHTINERYKLEALLGDGGMGTVYRAYDLNLDRQMAIKLMHAHFARRAEFRARLIQEAKTAAQLDHPSVVGIYDFGDSSEGLFIGMEYVDGGSLRDHLRRLQRMQKYLPLVQSLQIAAQIADALDYAYRKGIIHRDVKPGNIMLKRLSRPDEPGEQPFRAMLTDFGLVKLSEGTGLTQSGATLGTPTYMSPEQCAGETLGASSDLYSLGIVLYELVTNRLPFSFQSLSEAISAHTKGDMPPNARDWRKDVPPIVDTILTRTLAKNPEERFANGAELAEALRSAMVALSGAPTQVMVRDEMDILDRVSDPPSGFELLIDTPGHPTSTVPLTKSVITLGRNADNDIVLPADGVSRHHARLQATALGWEVVDLGGINGTLLNERRLRADDPTPASPGVKIHIGPYELTLRGPEVAIMEPAQEQNTMPTMGRVTPGLQQTGYTQVNTIPEPLALFLANDKITVDPSQEATFSVEVVNRSQIDDRVSVRIQGVPAAWIVTPGEFVTVNAGETAQIAIMLRPPRHRSTPTGRQRVRLQLISQQHPETKPAVTASLQIGTFVAFEAGMDAEELVLPGLINVSVQNTGNAPGSFSVVARDRQRALQFRGEQGRIRLQPGQTAKVELQVDGQSSGLFSGGELYPFEVEVASHSGGQQILSGTAKSGASVPPLLLYSLLFLLTLVCGFSIFLASGLFDRPSNANNEVPTTVPVAGIDLTMTATALTPAVPITVTAVLPTGDSDGDGLLNDQEAAAQTDPNNPDSDGDGLTDGQEVLEFGTNPNNVDTDGDVLRDGDEVNLYFTDPRLVDTDGDGVPDGTEVTQGTDPVATTIPTNTATVQPTTEATPTITLTPEPSLTPTLTNTPPPSTTPTQTPIPSATATQTLIPTNTATPTITPTLEPTPTATNTAVPNPQLVCTDAPPAIDGVFDVTEWPGAPLVQFEPEGQEANRVQLFFVRDTTNLYLAFLINDETEDDNDSLRLYFDTTRNGGDPDSADRFFQVLRDGTVQIQAGQNGNGDGQEWNSNYTSNFFQVEIDNSLNDQWVVEIVIDASAEMSALSDPFGMMISVLYTGSLATWPEDGISNSLDTYQGVNNVICESGS
ncbi:MAG: protein kinase [Chloroflexota bacterium]